MKFSYETQGAITYLVCELESTDLLDTLTLGMLTNNHINGLAPVLYTEMDGQRFLKYNISAKIAANQFFSGNMNKQRTMQAFQSILNALCAADDYMIDQNCFSVKPEHIFLNVSNCEAALVCIPVVSDKNINTEAVALFKNILETAQFDSSEDSGYIAQMKSALDNEADFSVYGFRSLVQQLASAPATPAAPVAPAAPAPVSPQPQSQPQVQIPPQPQVNHNPAPPASMFDSTISIYDMPASMGGQQPPATHNAPVVNQQSAQPQPQIRRPVPVQPPQPKNPPIPQPSNPAPKPQKMPSQNNAGFAIPGQSSPSFAIPGQEKQKVNTLPPQPAQTEPQPAEGQDDKKMSFLGLMMHYNKENAALYKSQKEASKGQPKEKPEKHPKEPKPAKQKRQKQPKGQPVPVPQPDNQRPGYPPLQGTPVSGAPNPPQQEYRPAVQPLPVQNSFNETTVLSAISGGGETTVLGEAAMPSEPYLTRVKSGERVYINKPVFRIGKEKSYVDYFIADNTAISRSHCNIHSENGEYFIEDTNSTNHTYINGQIINSNVKVKLSSGDKVRLANEDFTFTI